jgi:hypothetical protein
MYYHFTTFKNLDSIKKNGLKPSIGDYTKLFHKETEKGNKNGFVYFSDTNNIANCWNALLFHIAKTTGKYKIPINNGKQKQTIVHQPITEVDLYKHGLIIAYKGHLKHSKDSTDYGIEIGDYYTENTIPSKNLHFIYGEKLIEFINDNSELHPNHIKARLKEWASVEKLDYYMGPFFKKEAQEKILEDWKNIKDNLKIKSFLDDKNQKKEKNSIKKRP